METTIDYYSILGMSSTASDDELRQAYRVAARRFHPDVNKSPGAPLIFKDINTAFEVLSDHGRRTEYDLRYRQALAEGPSLTIETFLSRRHLKPLPEPQLLYALAKIQPTTQQKIAVDAPLNVCLVIDRSKSMAGIRMQHVKSAAYRIIDGCKPADLFSMVVFSDDAEVVIPAQHPEDPRGLKAMVSTIRPDGATAMLPGLRLGMSQIERNRAPQYVNHMILITDGRTYGDENDCLALAQRAREYGVGISGMGIGEDWNDRFLDALAFQTGGSSTYITSPDTVTKFLDERIRSLASACAERSHFVAAPVAEVELKDMTRISPDALTLPIDQQPVMLGVIDGIIPTTVMLQFHVVTSNAEPGEFFVGRIDLGADLLGTAGRTERTIKDLTVTVGPEDIEEEPPLELLDALSKLMLYRLQDKAREAIEMGDIAQATRSLEYLATRLFEHGEEELGNAALQEARQIAHTQVLSEEGAKRLKYGTRALMPQSGDKNG